MNPYATSAPPIETKLVDSHPPAQSLSNALLAFGGAVLGYGLFAFCKFDEISSAAGVAGWLPSYYVILCGIVISALGVMSTLLTFSIARGPFAAVRVESGTKQRRH